MCKWVAQRRQSRCTDGKERATRKVSNASRTVCRGGRAATANSESARMASRHGVARARYPPAEPGHCEDREGGVTQENTNAAAAGVLERWRRAGIRRVLIT